MAGQKVGPSRFEVNWVVCSGKGIICPTIERVFQLVVIDWGSDELNFSVPVTFPAQVPTCTLSSIESCGFMTHGLPVTHLAFSVASLLSPSPLTFSLSFSFCFLFPLPPSPSLWTTMLHYILLLPHLTTTPCRTRLLRVSCHNTTLALFHTS